MTEITYESTQAAARLRTGEVHPIADRFPMMTDDELLSMAESILEIGLLQPIILDEQMTDIVRKTVLAVIEEVQSERSGVIEDYVLESYDPGELHLVLTSILESLAKGKATKVAKVPRKGVRLMDAQRLQATLPGTPDAIFPRLVVVTDPETKKRIAIPGSLATLDQLEAESRRHVAAASSQMRVAEAYLKSCAAARAAGFSGSATGAEIAAQCPTGELES